MHMHMHVQHPFTAHLESFYDPRCTTSIYTIFKQVFQHADASEIVVVRLLVKNCWKTSKGDFEMATAGPTGEVNELMMLHFSVVVYRRG